MPLAPTLRTFVCVLNQHVIIQPALCPLVLQVHSSRGCCPGTGVTYYHVESLPTQSISDLVHPNHRATSTRQAAQVSIYHSSVACDGASAPSTATIYTGGEHLIKKFVLIPKKKKRKRGGGLACTSRWWPRACCARHCQSVLYCLSIIELTHLMT